MTRGRDRSCGCWRSLAVVIAIGGLAEGSPARADGHRGLTDGDRADLLRYARDSWHAFEAMDHPSGIPSDGVQFLPDGTRKPSERTSPTDIGASLWSTVAAARLGIIDDAEAGRRLGRTVAALEKLERAHGFFLSKYVPVTGEVLKLWPVGKTPVRPFLSAVDNGWLAASLIVVRNARPELRDRADALLTPMDFGFFHEPFDPKDPDGHPGQIRGGVFLDDRSWSPFYGMLNTEPRIASYIAIARGQVPPEHYFRIYRTLPAAQAQEQKPAGVTRTYRGVPVFEGHYTYRGMEIVPSWGGSMFEAMMVPLFVPESAWAPGSWGTNHPLYVRAQIEHGLVEARYGFWGFSPCCKPEGGYQTYGVSAVGTSPEGYPSHNGRRAGPPFTDGVVTPHASFLALRYAPREAMDNLGALAAKFPAIYGPFGFRDSVNVTTGAVSDHILALDQGMILAAIANALADDAIQRAFSDGAIESAIRPLIADESFTAGGPSPPGRSPGPRPSSSPPSP